MSVGKRWRMAWAQSCGEPFLVMPKERPQHLYLAMVPKVRVRFWSDWALADLVENAVMNKMV